MQLTKAHYFEGRKLRRKLEAVAKKEAKLLLSGELGEGTTDLADARAMMETYHWMKSKHIDSIIVEKKLLGGWVVMLAFKDLPRGMPNILGAPVKVKSEEQAMFEANRLLRAAYIKCEDTKKMMRDNVFTDARIFRLQDVNLQVPGEMVDAAARKIPDIPPEKEAQKMRMTHIDTIGAVLGKSRLTGELWDNMSEDSQVKLMVEASYLLCLNINIVA
jgi:hypothetical protein